MLTTVIKLGGAESEDLSFLRTFARELSQLKNTEIVIVHGGGSAISKLQEEAGIPIQKIDGLRVTDARTLELVKLMLWKKINSEIVQTLRAEGVDSVGLAGFENQLLIAKKIIRTDGQDLGFVGEVSSVSTGPIRKLLSEGKVAVIAPIGVDASGQAYNINADSAALGIALALKSQSIRFVTNVSGVLKEGKRIDRLNEGETEVLIREGVITGGMIPKVRAALSARSAGIPEVWITKDGREGTVFQ